MQRRAFLKGAGSLALATTPWAVSCKKRGRPAAHLVRDPRGILDLPPGFDYRILERSGERMSDGHAAGERPDGMACFAGSNDSWILMRNHELDAGRSPVPSVAYDPERLGGVSRLVVDRSTLERKSSNWVLTGTSRNCAGGPSAWGWLSCEETTEAGHGYVFLCDPRSERATRAVRLPSLGRFRHEAAAVDPNTHVVYLTEDERDSCLYRHVPEQKERDPFVGSLSALAVGSSTKRLAKGVALGDRFTVKWVPIADAEGNDAPVREQAARQGAALVDRGEGIWAFGGSIFFVSTDGGPTRSGQVFRLDPTETGGTLTLVAQADEEPSFTNPDNITVSPTGDVFVVENGTRPNHIHRLAPDGSVFPFGRNRIRGGKSELCGVCFSPDGRVMFVNIQDDGLTLGITGPFGRV